MRKNYLLCTAYALPIVLSLVTTNSYGLNIPTLPNPFAKKAQVSTPASAPAIATQQPTAAAAQAASTPAATQPVAAPSKPATPQLTLEGKYAIQQKEDALNNSVYNAILRKCDYMRGLFLYKSNPEKVATLKALSDESDKILDFSSPDVLKALAHLNIKPGEIATYLTQAQALGEALDAEVEARLDREATNQFGVSSMDYDRLSTKISEAVYKSDSISEQYPWLKVNEPRQGIDEEIQRRRKVREDAATAKAAAEQAERQKNANREIQFDPNTGGVARRADRSVIYVDDPDNPFKGK
jgi:hypothetical protein